MPLQAATEEIFDRYCQALLTELRLRRHEVGSDGFSTIYIGGGTPTALPSHLLLNLIRHLRQEGCPSGIREFTVEANPEDISEQSIVELRQAGVDRISIGVQSFDTPQLQSVSRRHSAEESLRALQVLRDSGINYSADLIYGLPGQTVESWERQLDTLLSFRPPHFSAYLLSYEPGTRLYAMRSTGKVQEASEATAVEMYRILCESAASHDYRHYEISNFALPSMEAKHNSAYWNLTPYLGLGCSAHSFDGVTRRYNPIDIRAYINSLLPSSGEPKAPFIVDDENEINRLNDYIITSLRTASGLSTALIASRWGEPLLERFLSNARPLVHAGQLVANGFGEAGKEGENSVIPEQENLIIPEQENLVIPERFWLTADAILREAILDSDF